MRHPLVLHALEDEVPAEALQELPPQLDEDALSDRSDLHNAGGATLVRSADQETDYEPSVLGEAPGEVEIEDPYQEAGEESSKKIAIRVPRVPTEEERREHEISHIPYRSWCGDCVRGKGLSSAHKQHARDDEDRGQRRPLVAIDYFYLGRDEERSLPILAMVEEQTGRTYAICMPEKGIGHQYNVAAAAKMLKVSGCLNAILKSDTERPLVALRSKLQEIYPNLGTEDATKGESQSNGLVESYVGKIQAQCRTMRSALDRHYPGIGPRHPVLPWMIDYAAALMSRFNRGVDGQTPYERSTGKLWRVKLPEFGETVWFQPLKGERAPGKMEPKFEEGIFLGLQEGSAMKWIGTPSGVYRCWTIKCKAGAERWDQPLMQMMVGLPWKLRPKEEDLEREVRVPLGVEMDMPPPVLEDEQKGSAEEPKRKRYQPKGDLHQEECRIRRVWFYPWMRWL
eukprot:s364_g27.t1